MTDFQQAKRLAMQEALRLNDVFSLFDREPHMDQDFRQRLLRMGLNPDFISQAPQLTVTIGNVKIEGDPNVPGDNERVERLAQSYIDKMPPPTLSKADADLASDSRPNIPKTVGQLIERWLTSNKEKWTDKTIVEYEAIANRFAEHSGRKLIRNIDSADVADYVDEQIKSGVKLKAISKHLTVIKGLFEHAVTRRAYPSNLPLPTIGQVRPTKASKSREARQNAWLPFDEDDLKRLFSASGYVKLKKPHEFWFPLLGLYSACRIEELSQLTIDDIKSVNGVWVFDINERENNKHLKTAHSERMTPIHSKILVAGFLDYLKDVEKIAGPKGRVFPYLRDDPVNGLSDVPSEAFGRYRKAVDVNHPKKVFHSFRKTANNRLKQNMVEEELRCEILGHEHKTVNSINYSNPINVPAKRVLLEDKLVFSEIDTSFIKYDPNVLLPILHMEVERRKRFDSNKSAKLARAKLKKDQ